MTRHVAAELAEHGIRVNAVSPGMVETRIFERFIPSDQLDSALQDFNSFHPLEEMELHVMSQKLLYFSFRIKHLG